MNYFWLKISKLLALAGDIALFYLSLFLTLTIRYGSDFNLSVWNLHWPIFTWLMIIWLMIFYAFNLYDFLVSAKNNNLEFLNNYLQAAVINLFLGIIYFYILSPKTDMRPKTILVILIVIFSLAYMIWRRLLVKLISSKQFFQNLVMVGFDPLMLELLPKDGLKSRSGFNFKGLVIDQPENAPAGINLKIISTSQLNDFIVAEKIDLLVINQPISQELTYALFKTMPLRINFTSLTNFYEKVTNRVPLKLINQGWFLENFSEGNKKFFDLGKRIIDLIFSLIFGIISLIFWPFIILVISFDNRGKIVFSQKRTGKDGQIFTALKFRTMYENAEKNGPMWAKENDPRITRVGRFLRKSRLDEIPQLWNILKGEMSFVGPRPERPEFISQLERDIPFYNERLLVKPGLTGWAQINLPYADSTEATLKKLQYDLYYIKHRSIFFDLSVILKTIKIIFKKLGR